MPNAAEHRFNDSYRGSVSASDRKDLTPVRIWALIAIGGILLFAVVGHPSFLNLQIVGLILIMRGAAGIWVDLGADGRARCVRRFRLAIAAGMESVDEVTADLARDDAARVPLRDLLGSRGGRERG